MTGTVGIDVGGSFVKAVLRRPDGFVERRARARTGATVAENIEVITALASELGPSSAVGVALAGLVDHRRGVLVWAPHLPGEEVPVADLLRRRLGVKVVVDNDANMAAVAEHRQGAAVGAASMVMLTLGTGIGMGLVVDGALVHGRAHAGEVGHITVDADGEKCPCGRYGCWETKVSGRRLDADAVEVLGEGRSAADLVAAARRGHPQAVERLAAAAGWLARGVEVIVLALDPEMVVVGGAAAQAGDLLLEPVRKRLAVTEGAAHRTPAVVTAGILGPDAGAVGAAIAAAEL
jgi:glucokinase